MNYLLIILTTVFMSLQSVLTKAYTEKTREDERATLVFNPLMSLSTLLIFVLLGMGKFSFHTPTVIYGAFNAIAMGTAILFCILAINNGSLSLSSLFISYSLIVPTLYGIIFLNERLSFLAYTGMALLGLSLYLINKTDEESKITFKWFIYAFLSFLGNGLCTTIQKIQQITYNGQYKSEFMIVTMFLITLGFLSFLIKKDVKKFKAPLKKGWGFAVLTGISNALVNLFVMFLALRMPAALMYPLISGGSVVITFFISRYLFKENLSKAQRTGFAIGTISIILLSL